MEILEVGNSLKKENNNIAKLLDEIYEEFKYYQNLKIEMKNKVESLLNELAKLKIELEKDTEISKLEKVKKQIDLLVTEESITLEQSKKADEFLELREKINSDIDTVERSINIGIMGDKLMKEEEIQEETPKFIFTVGLSKVYNYYKNASQILKNNEEKTKQLEELIDEMIVEVIRKEMEEKNVVLPEFMEETRYFKHENKNKLENLGCQDNNKSEYM